MMRPAWSRWMLMGALLTPAIRMSAQTSEDADSVSRIRVRPALGLRFGTPERASLALGIVTGTEWKTASHPTSPEVAMYVEPGWSGGRASLGLIKGIGNLGSGIGVAGTVLRTWNDPWGLRDNQTYVGGEVWAWPLFFVGPRLGIFRSVRGTAGKGWFITGDFGFGL